MAQWVENDEGGDVTDLVLPNVVVKAAA